MRKMMAETGYMPTAGARALGDRWWNERPDEERPSKRPADVPHIASTAPEVDVGPPPPEVSRFAREWHGDEEHDGEEGDGEPTHGNWLGKLGRVRAGYQGRYGRSTREGQSGYVP